MREHHAEKKSKLKDAIKKKDGWWASLFAGPFANKLLYPIADINWITPNHITIFSLFVGLVAAFCFAQGSYRFLVIGAILVQLSFVIDCMDGQLARYRQQFSKLGAWLDRISDRVKDFLYIFSLAWGFQATNPEVFFLGMKNLSDLFAYIYGAQCFRWPVDLQVLLMRNAEFPTWIIWPTAMLALFAVFLIDYYVNQDMKLETRVSSNENPTTPVNSPAKSFVKKFFNFGLKVYEAIPILRFNIGEQAFLISFFCLINSVFPLLCAFAGLGLFYCLYWPLAKYYGFAPSK